VFRTGAMAAQATGVCVHTTVWVSASVATAVARRARKLAGDCPDVATATNALAQAAADHRVKLTPNDVAISRAQAAAMKLSAYLAGRGVLRDFNAAFKQRHEAAAMQGKGFMSYRAAETRLRRALIPMLANGGTIGRDHCSSKSSPLKPRSFCGLFAATREWRVARHLPPNWGTLYDCGRSAEGKGYWNSGV
jgi:hypothetical protein